MDDVELTVSPSISLTVEVTAEADRANEISLRVVGDDRKELSEGTEDVTFRLRVTNNSNTPNLKVELRRGASEQLQSIVGSFVVPEVSPSSVTLAPSESEGDSADVTLTISRELLVFFDGATLSLTVKAVSAGTTKSVTVYVSVPGVRISNRNIK